MKKRKFDAVVLGSGVGGLCAAARMMRMDMKVLVVERLPFLGGRFSTRLIKGFRLPTGAMVVPHGPRSAFQEAFDLAGIPLEVRMPKGETTYRLPHGDYEVPPDGGGMAGMLEFALQDKEEAKRVFREFKRALVWWEPVGNITFRQWLEQHTHNTNVHNMFQGFCAAFVGVNSNEVPASEFFRFIKAMGRNVAYGIAPMGNMKLMNDLADGIADKGVDIVRECNCKQILVEKNMVTGVIIEKNMQEELIEADFVISNAGPSQTVVLAGPENFELSYLTLLREHNFTVPVVYIAISSPEPLNKRHGVLNFGNTRRLVFLETPTITCPELAPEGRHMTITFSVPKFSTGPLNLRETIDMALLDLQENFPGFKNAELLHVGTHHGDWPTMHRWPGYPMPIRTSIENLYNVGDGCMPSGTVGVEACAITARMVADDIKR
ncbi:MAG: NAD(P)/FAD-dependent oxidoreductase [Desulfobacterales bacterium]